MTRDVEQMILGALRAGCFLEHAAEAAGVDESTVYRHVKRSPSFARSVQRARAAAIVRTQTRLMQTIDSGNVSAMKFFLAVTAPARYTERQRHELVGDGGGPIMLDAANPLVQRAAKELRDALSRQHDALPPD